MLLLGLNPGTVSTKALKTITIQPQVVGGEVHAQRQPLINQIATITIPCNFKPITAPSPAADNTPGQVLAVARGDSTGTFTFMVPEGQYVITFTGSDLMLVPSDFAVSTTDPVVKQFIHGEPDGPIPLRRSRVDYETDILA